MAPATDSVAATDGNEAMTFRTRLIAAAAGVVGLVLAAVLALVWLNVRKIEIERLDARLCLEARRLASQPFGADVMDRLEADVLGKLRLGETAQLLLRIEPPDGMALQSAHWPVGLGVEDLRWTPLPEREWHALPPPPAPRTAMREAARASSARRGSSSGFECSLASFDNAGSEWHAGRVTGPAGRGFVAADSAAAADELLGVARGTVAITYPLALGLVALGAWLLSAVSIRPVIRLRDAMRSVRRTDLSQRLPSDGEDREFRELIASYNAMLDRLQASFEQASRFSADAAHELRTPLTILQGRLEEAIRRSEQGAIQSDLADMLDELGRLASITRKLLLLSQADAGSLALHRTPVDMTELLNTLVADAQMLGTDQKVSGTVEPNLVVHGDALLLRQLLNNVVSNAVRYCPSGGWIEIAGRRVSAGVELTIANASAPISAENRSRIFDRFYRLDAARNRRSEGSGLGLSLARAIARAHGGDLVLEPSPEDVVRLRLSLPLA